MGRQRRIACKRRARLYNDGCYSLAGGSCLNSYLQDWRFLMAEKDDEKAKEELSTLTASVEKLKSEIQQIHEEAEKTRKVIEANAKAEQELKRLLR
jgi:hypothetical protein